MNTSLKRSGAGSRASETSQQIETDAVLSVLDDPDCRRILAAITSSPATASELIEGCDLPSSTAYRKLDRLTETNLIEERTRLRTDGNHVSEYVCSVSALTLELSPDGISVTVDARDDSETEADAAAEPAVSSY